MIVRKECDRRQDERLLVVPNKFLHACPSYFRQQGKHKATIHYLLDIRLVNRCTGSVACDVKAARQLEILYPSGRIRFLRVARVKRIDQQYKFIIYHRQSQVQKPF